MWRTLAACFVCAISNLPVAHGATARAWDALAEGTITDPTHPNRSGDLRTFNVRIRAALHEQTGEGEVTIAGNDRPGEPLTGRSFALARHVEELGLQADRCVTAWPPE